MKKPWLSAILNFFLMGAGYLYNGKRMLLGLLLTIGAIGLTYLENFYAFPDGNTLSAHNGTAFGILFFCVFIVNLGLAVDAYQEANSLNQNVLPA